MKSVALAILLLGAAGCSFGPRAIVLPEPEAAGAGVMCEDLVVSYCGARIGWSRSTHSFVELDGKQVVYRRTHSWICYNQGRYPEPTRRVFENWRSLDGKDIRAVLVESREFHVRRVEATWGDDITFAESIDGARPTISRVKPGSRPFYSDEAALAAVMAEGARPGLRLEYQMVDLAWRSLEDCDLIVVGRVQKRTQSGRLFEGIGIRSDSVDEADFYLFTESGTLLYADYSHGVVAESVDKVPSPFAVDPLPDFSSIHADVSVLDLNGLTEMEIEFLLADPLTNTGAPLLEANAYQDVSLTASGFALRLKEWHPSEAMLGVPYPLPAIPDEARAYLNATPMCESDDEGLVAEASRLTSGRKTSVAAVAELSTFVRDRLTRGRSGMPAMASAKEAYDRRKGDCTEFSALFVALARASGLPARINVGLLYTAPLFVGFSWHAWAEVWIGEWIPIDATRPDFGVSARYLLVDAVTMDDKLPDSRMVKLARARWIRIDGYRLKDGTTWRRNGQVSRFADPD